MDVYAPEQDDDLDDDRVRVSLGHMACKAKKDLPKHASLLRVRDSDCGLLSGDSKHMREFLARFLPTPRRFKQVWSKQVGEQKFFAWQPVPPNNHFVALGHVTSNSEDQPPLDCVRCVPRRWVSGLPCNIRREGG